MAFSPSLPQRGAVALSLAPVTTRFREIAYRSASYGTSRPSSPVRRPTPLRRLPRPHGHRVSDGPQRLSLRPERDDFANSLLLGLIRDEIAVLAAPETERNLAAEIPARAFWSAFTCPIRSRMRSRSASAKAAAIVRNSLDRPLPEMSPPRSSRWRATPRSPSPSVQWTSEGAL
jgi:hypothetical protein